MRPSDRKLIVGTVFVFQIIAIFGSLTMAYLVRSVPVQMEIVDAKTKQLLDRIHATIPLKVDEQEKLLNDTQELIRAIANVGENIRDWLYACAVLIFVSVAMQLLLLFRSEREEK